MEPLLVIARTLHFTATIALFGVFAWDCLIVPARGAGMSELRRPLALLAWSSLLLTLLSGALWLLAIAGEMSGKPLAAVLSQRIWETVLGNTRFGTVWLVRLALAAAIALCLILAPPSGSARRATSWIGVALGGALLAGLAWAGHGGATPGMPGEVHLAADIVHLVAAGLWLGTLVPFAVMLAAARRGGEPAHAAGAVARRFSQVAIVSVASLVVGGLVNTWFLAGTVPALVGTNYGRLLLVKIALFIAMLAIAAVNLRWLVPNVGDDGAQGTIRPLRRNALIETALGVAVLAVVAMLGILPPGLHSEAGWPLPIRVDLGVLTTGAKVVLVVLAAAIGLCVTAATATTAAGHYRHAALAGVGIVLALAGGWTAMRPAIEAAYPTSFYRSAEPYSAASISRGAALYAANCALCHGANGTGDGPAAANLPARPADLTAPHLFGHSPGDLFWWISHGKGEAMPGFAAVMQPAERWDVVNFVRARAAGVLARRIGERIVTAAALPFPDFTFEIGGKPLALRRVLAEAPVLVVLFAPPAPVRRFTELTQGQPWFAHSGLSLIAVDIGGQPKELERRLPDFVVSVAPDVAASLALFAGSSDGGETELLVDRGGNIRARWVASGEGGLPNAAILAEDAEHVARAPVAAPSHAGHQH